MSVDMNDMCILHAWPGYKIVKISSLTSVLRVVLFVDTNLHFCNETGELCLLPPRSAVKVIESEPSFCVSVCVSTLMAKLGALFIPEDPCPWSAPTGPRMGVLGNGKRTQCLTYNLDFWYGS